MGGQPEVPERVMTSDDGGMTPLLFATHPWQSWKEWLAAIRPSGRGGRRHHRRRGNLLATRPRYSHNGGVLVSLEHTRATMTAFLQDLAQRGPFARHFADDVTYTVISTGQVIAGRAAVEQFIRHVHEDTFAARLPILSAVIDADRMFLELEFVGTHTGAFEGVAATGRAVRVPTGTLFTLRDEQIIAMHCFLPIEQLRQQIGAAHSAGVE